MLMLILEFVEINFSPYLSFSIQFCPFLSQNPQNNTQISTKYEKEENFKLRSVKINKKFKKRRNKIVEYIIRI